MRIAYYCQHVLGVGHFHRSLEICRALAAHHDVTMITGGCNLDIQEKSISFFQLPGLMMDTEFNNLSPCDPSQHLENVKNKRKDLLFDFFLHHRPEIFLVELYPFGRKAFRFELDPVLNGIRNSRLSSCRTYCSLRDILVERSDKEKFEQRIITTINSLFDGLLIHGDQHFTPLSETFSRTAEIAVPTIYTGYVTPKPDKNSNESVRQKLQIPSGSQLIVASLGGGNVGGELLVKMAQALKKLHDRQLFLQIFTGPYADPDILTKLNEYADEHIRVARFTTQFPNWLAAADLSVSMAGYNTCMNILAAGVPALLYPFRQNREQDLRVQKLAKHVPFKILQKNDLEPAILTKLVRDQLKKTRYVSPINLNGAANTALQIEKWHSS